MFFDSAKLKKITAPAKNSADYFEIHAEKKCTLAKHKYPRPASRSPGTPYIIKKV